MIACVADASILLKTILQEPDSEAAFDFLARNPPAAPAVARIEIVNVIRRLVVGRRHTIEEGRDAFETMMRRITLVPETDGQASFTLELAIALDHSATDCRYLAAAAALDLPLYTADAAFARKARAKGHDVRTP
mgnify:CR=1 FL=1